MLNQEEFKTKIVNCAFPEKQYLKTEYPKAQICLHYLASVSAMSSIRYWEKTDDRVATPYVIDRNGTIYCLYDDKYWAFHLGVGLDNKHKYEYRIKGSKYDKQCIGIELASFGWLKKDEKGFQTAYKNYVPNDEVCTLDKPHRGKIHYHKFTNLQIAALKELLIYLAKKWNIPADFRSEIFDVDTNALDFKPGIYTHNSYVHSHLRQDIFPQKEIIEMLKSLPDAIQ